MLFSTILNRNLTFINTFMPHQDIKRRFKKISKKVLFKFFPLIVRLDETVLGELSTIDTLKEDFVRRYVSRCAPGSSRGESRIGTPPNFMGNLQFVAGSADSISLLVIIDYPLDRQYQQLREQLG